mmetsp:Transcript_16732/g.45306  ORF Transcript_16732/g.45306 Transcript_16732/m.45306 type:complete len:148 (+) Transcript_16732:396-839(+)
MLSCTIFSECESKALVASSKMRIAGCLTIALAMATLCFWPPLSDVIFTVSFQVSVFAPDVEVFAEALSVCFVGLHATRSTILSNLSCVQPNLLRSPCKTIRDLTMGSPTWKVGSPSTKSTCAIFTARITSSGVALGLPYRTLFNRLS